MHINHVNHHFKESNSTFSASSSITFNALASIASFSFFSTPVCRQRHAKWGWQTQTHAYNHIHMQIHITYRMQCIQCDCTSTFTNWDRLTPSRLFYFFPASPLLPLFYIPSPFLLPFLSTQMMIPCALFVKVSSAALALLCCLAMK